MGPPPSAGARPPRTRDLRLDLARGLTMLIIFVAHVPSNSWAEFIPARMGFSSGAEAFVLCSGLACGLAFGGAYRREGWAAGTRRIGRRALQLWGAQIAAFLGFALLMLAIDHALGTHEYRDRYALDFLASQPFAAIAALAGLRYVPIFFDILPLYIVLLAAMPLVMLLARLQLMLVMAASGGLWLLAQLAPLGLPAHPLSDRIWYFDPLAWQFLFLIGFGAAAGWFAPPQATRARILLAAAAIILCVPLTFWAFHEAWPPLRELFLLLYPAEAITTLHPLRLAHVLALGWLFAALLAPVRTTLGQGALAPIVLVGQQSLTTFLCGVFLSALAGVALDLIGRGALAVAAVNLAGMAALVAAAHVARLVKAGRFPLPFRKEIAPCPGVL